MRTYKSEADKVRDLPQVMQYIKGSIADVGAGHDKITDNALGIDGRALEGINYVTDDVLTLDRQLESCADAPFDTVFSSHFLEHISDQYRAILSWTYHLKPGGYFVLYLPDGRYYDNKQNLEHMVDMNYDDFMFWFKRSFCGEGKDFRGNYIPQVFELIDSSLDVGQDRYSFYVIARKL